MTAKYRVSSWRNRSGSVAQCDGCEIDPDVTRKQVQDHVATTGHTARFMVEDVTKYEPDSQA